MARDPEARDRGAWAVRGRPGAVAGQSTPRSAIPRGQLYPTFESHVRKPLIFASRGPPAGAILLSSLTRITTEDDGTEEWMKPHAAATPEVVDVERLEYLPLGWAPCFA